VPKHEMEVGKLIFSARVQGVQIHIREAEIYLDGKYVEGNSLKDLWLAPGDQVEITTNFEWDFDDKA